MVISPLSIPRSSISLTQYPDQAGRFQLPSTGKPLRPHGHTPGLIADAGAPDSRPPAELNDISSLRGEHPVSA
jgi:hypothetical protein